MNEIRPLLTKYWAELKEHWPEVIPSARWIFTALVLSAVLSLAHSSLEPLPGVITLLLLPGATVMTLLRVRPATTAGRMALAVSLSMMSIMIVGFVVSVLGPPIGLAHPLDVIPERFIWALLTIFALALCIIKGRDPVTWVLEGVTTPHIFVFLAGFVLVVLSILGVGELNHSGNAHLAIFSMTLDVAVLVAAIVGGWRRNSQWPLNIALYCVSLALLVSTSLRGEHLYGWDDQQEFGVAAHTLVAGAWTIPANHDAYASMLSLTVLPAVLHSVTSLYLLAFFQLVVPAILAFLPLAVYATARAVPRWINSGRAAPRPGVAFAVVVALIISSIAFAQQLMSITRQAMALTMLTTLVMVLFDRTITKRTAQVTIALLLVGISFTHYTTSYLLAGIFLCAWFASWVWSKGWLGIPASRIKRHQHEMRSRRVINVFLVGVAFASAFGWNLAITRNSALSAPTSAVSSKGAGLETSIGSSTVGPRELERIMVNEYRTTYRWITPVPRSGAVPLTFATAPSTPGVFPSLDGLWNDVTFLTDESLWGFLGLALLYGIIRLGRRRSYEYSSDLVGLAVAGLMIGGFLRFSGTLAAYYSPVRAAIFTAILLSAPATLFFDDVVTTLYSLKARLDNRLAPLSIGAGIAYLLVLVAGATGLGTLVFGGNAPGALSGKDVNAEDYSVTTQEQATAVWLRTNVHSPDAVQSDLFGHLVLLSEPGTYDLLDEIMPQEVDVGAYIYLSTINLDDHLAQAEDESGIYSTTYRSTISFFARNFYVVYSTGDTRVYH